MPFRLGVPPEIVLVTLGAACLAVVLTTACAASGFAQNDCSEAIEGRK